MNKLLVSILILIEILCITGCQSLEYLFQKPTVTFNTIKVKDMSLNEATAVFYFDVSNPNPMGGTLSRLTYDLAVNQKSIASGTADKGIQIPANGIKTVELPVSINYFDIIDSVTDLIEKKEIAYDLTGTFTLMGFDLPYQTSGILPLPELPHVMVKEISINNFSWAGAALNFVLELENNNAFNVNVKQLEYTISIGGKSMISGKSKKGTSIPQNGKTTMNVPLDVNFIRLGKSAFDLLAGESSEYGISGEMIFNTPEGEKRFPFSNAGSVPLIK
jgi:LEA14-like dessication related protein